MGISFFLKKAIFTFRTAFSLSFAMKFQRRHWLEDFAWRVEVRGTRDTKIQVIEVSVSSLYISSLW
jgi:hypothetical protein